MFLHICRGDCVPEILSVIVSLRLYLWRCQDLLVILYFSLTLKGSGNFALCNRLWYY